MENELDKVEEGDLDWHAVLGDFWGPFNRALEAVDINKIIPRSARLDRTRHGKVSQVRRSARSQERPVWAVHRVARACVEGVRLLRSIKRTRCPTGRRRICKDCGAPMVIKTAGRRISRLHPLSQVARHAAGPARHQCPKCGRGSRRASHQAGTDVLRCLRYPMRLFHLENRSPSVPSCGLRGREESQVQDDGETKRKCLKCGHRSTSRSRPRSGRGDDVGADMRARRCERWRLAGCRAAWRCRAGVRVTLHEMRPVRMTRRIRPRPLAERLQQHLKSVEPMHGTAAQG